MSGGAIIGRAPCPLKGGGCDNDSAHVKQSAGKHPYVYCPACGCTLPARNGVQAGYLLRLMRPPALAAPAPAPAAPAPAPAAAAPAAPAPAPAPEPKRRSSWAPVLEAFK